MTLQLAKNLQSTEPTAITDASRSATARDAPPVGLRPPGDAPRAVRLILFVAAQTDTLRAVGMRRHEGKAIEWTNDQLPALPELRSRGGRFDLILLTAVWMHLDEAERRSGMAALESLLAAGGRLSLSLRHGPVPPGRRMFDVPAEETIALASSSGLRLVHSVEREDMLGRADVRWSFVVLEKP